MQMFVVNMCADVYHFAAIVCNNVLPKGKESPEQAWKNMALNNWNSQYHKCLPQKNVSMHAG